MALRFDDGFSGVRVHADDRAFTADGRIVFASRESAPKTAPGPQLLAHERTHVLQQRRAAASLPARVTAPADALAAELRIVIGSATWKEVRKGVYRKESAAGIKPAEERRQATAGLDRRWPDDDARALRSGRQGHRREVDETEWEEMKG